MKERLYRLTGRTAIAYAGQSVKLDGRVHVQPTEDMLYAAGYRPMGEAQRPEYDADTQYLKMTGYALCDDGTAIVPLWEVVNRPGVQSVEKRVSDLEEALELLLSDAEESESDEQSVEGAGAGV